jgi:hypothetical protein
MTAEYFRHKALFVLASQSLNLDQQRRNDTRQGDTAEKRVDETEALTK